MLGLQRLPGQIALAVHDALGLARRAGGERHQRGVVRRKIGVRRRCAAPGGVVVQPEHGAVRRDLVEHRAVARVGHDRRHAHGGEARRQVVRAQLLVARQRDESRAQRADQRADPLGAVAGQRDDDVAAPQAELVQGRRELLDAGADLRERPLAARSVPRALDQRRCAGRPLEKV